MFPTDHRNRPWVLICRVLLGQKDAGIRHEKSPEKQGVRCDKFYKGTKRAMLRKLKVASMGKDNKMDDKRVRGLPGAGPSRRCRSEVIEWMVAYQ